MGHYPGQPAAYRGVELGRTGGDPTPPLAFLTSPRTLAVDGMWKAPLQVKRQLMSLSSPGSIPQADSPTKLCALPACLGLPGVQSLGERESASQQTWVL
uniref:Uncharacterized protein n=1 Tax=Peromyscus maniculatus bairdii TaxID=230844 RepID=A0A8C8W3F6_PERMB